MRRETGKTLYMMAIRRLPNKWIDDETIVSIWGTDIIYAFNPKYGPMTFKRKRGKWQKVFIGNSDPEANEN